MRKLLDFIYTCAGVLSGLCMVALFGVTLAGVLSRLFGIYLPGLDGYAGYLLANCSFLGFVYASKMNGHVRMSLVLNAVSAPTRFKLEVWSSAIGVVLVGYLAFYFIDMALVSFEYGDVSEGQDRTALWIPQIGLAVGSVLFVVSQIDRLICLFVAHETLPNSDDNSIFSE